MSHAYMYFTWKKKHRVAARFHPCWSLFPYDRFAPPYLRYYTDEKRDNSFGTTMSFYFICHFRTITLSCALWIIGRASFSQARLTVSSRLSVHGYIYMCPCALRCKVTNAVVYVGLERLVSSQAPRWNGKYSVTKRESSDEPLVELDRVERERHCVYLYMEEEKRTWVFLSLNIWINLRIWFCVPAVVLELCMMAGRCRNGKVISHSNNDETFRGKLRRSTFLV